MGSKSSQPQQPDYIGAAQAQGDANIQAARTTSRLSNPNIIGPYGTQSVSYGPQLSSRGQQEFDAFQSYGGWVPEGDVYRNTKTGEVSDNPVGHGLSGSMRIFSPEEMQQVQMQDQPTVTQKLAPEQQQLFDRQNALKLGLADVGQQGISRVQGVMAQPFDGSPYQMQDSFGYQNPLTSFDTSGIAKMPVNAGMTGQNAIMARLQPLQDRRRSMQETQLVNQGLRPGQEAYGNAIGDLGRQENDELNQAALYGLGLDMSANQQGFGQALQQGQFANQGIAQGYQQGLGAAQFGNTARQQALQQALTQRELPLNEVTALMSGSQVQNPQFQQYTGSQAAPPNIAGATQAQGQFNQGLFNANTAAQNGMYGGLAQLGSAGMMGYGMYGAGSAAAAAAAAGGGTAAGSGIAAAAPYLMALA